MTNTIPDNILITRDLINRYESLNNDDDAQLTPEEKEERDRLDALLSALKGYGDDEEWQGEWYPQILILDSHFLEYTKQLAEECYDLDDQRWPLTCIDWAKAAQELQRYYHEVGYEGEIYWYR